MDSYEESIEKAQERRILRDSCRINKSPREAEAQEGRSFRPVSVLVGSLDRVWETNPEGEAPANPMRAATHRKGVRLTLGKHVPEGQNPKGVAGTKQGRSDAGGSRPRERRNAEEAP